MLSRFFVLFPIFGFRTDESWRLLVIDRNVFLERSRLLCDDLLRHT